MVAFITDEASCDNEARATESTPMRRLATARRNAPGTFRGSASQVLRDVAASHSQTAVAAAETLRRHIRALLLRQQRRCGVTLSDCCCGSRTLRRHTLKLLLRQQRRCGVTFAGCCCGSSDVAASHLQTAVAAAGQRLRSTVVPAQRHRQWCVRRDCDRGAGNRSDGGNSCNDGSAGSRRCSTISLTADWDAAG